MNKLFSISSIVLSGLILGSLAGKTSVSESTSLKVKRNNLSKSAKSLKRYIKKNKDEDELNQYFI